MSITPVTWSPGDPFDISKLQQMNDNDVDVDLRLPEIHYRYEGGADITNNIVMCAGVEDFGVPPGTDHSQVVNFPAGAFDAACKPVVQITLQKWQSKTMGMVIHGIPAGQQWPDSSGFRVHLIHDNRNTPLNSPIKLHWVAIGWRV